MSQQDGYRDSQQAQEVVSTPTDVATRGVPRPSPARWYVATLYGDFADDRHIEEFNEEFKEHIGLLDDGTTARDLDYVKYQWERCPTTFRIHAQMTLYFKTKVRPHSVVTFLNQFKHTHKPHVEKCVNPQKSLEYCEKSRTKYENFDTIEIGTCPKEGKSTNLVRATSMLEDGSSLRQVARAFPAEFVRHGRGLAALRNILAEPEDEGAAAAPPELCVFLGVPGTGKSHQARAWREDGWRAYVIPVDDKFWIDGYEGQELAVLDEYQGQYKLNLLLRLTDGFTVRVPYKGGFIWWCPKRVAITSTKEPSVWYNYKGRLDEFAALLRRITCVCNCRKVDDEYTQEWLRGEELARWKRLLVPRLEPLGE